MNKPQLSAEMEKRLEEFECNGYTCNHETAEDHYIIDKHFLATALEEQRVQIKEVIERLKGQEYQSVDLPYDENTFEHGVNEGLFQGIVALEAILNGKEE